MNPQIENILLQLPENKMQLAAQLREIILAGHHDVEEIIKWTRVTFVSDKKDIAFICSCPGKPYIELGFFKAVYLSDPQHLFEGKGKEIKRIKVFSLESIPAAQIQDWVNEAVNMNVNIFHA